MIGSKGVPASHVRGGGGIEALVEELAVRLAEKGHAVTVYVRGYANPKKLKKFRGLNLVTIPTVPTKNLDTITYSILATLHMLSQEVDVVHYHAVGPSTLSWVPRIFKYRTRVVCTFHARDRFHSKWGVLARAYLAFGEWACIAFPHRTIAISHIIYRFCIRMFGAKNVVYIPNGVEIPTPHRSTTCIESMGLVPHEYFYTLSRLIPFKRIEDAIHAFHKVDTTKKLVIIGDAAEEDLGYEEKLHHLARKDPRVVFLGRRPHEEVDELIAHAYAMVHPSSTEGLSVALLESMACGRLVIMSDIPENLELVDHSALSFPLRDVAALTAAIQMAVDDPTMVEERGQRAKEVIRRLYTWGRVVDKTEKMYQDIAM